MGLGRGRMYWVYFPYPSAVYDDLISTWGGAYRVHFLIPGVYDDFISTWGGVGWTGYISSSLVLYMMT